MTNELAAITPVHIQRYALRDAAGSDGEDHAEFLACLSRCRPYRFAISATRPKSGPIAQRRATAERSWLYDADDDLSHKDGKSAAPDCCAMQPSGRPQVVGGEQQKKQVCRVTGNKRVMKKDWYVPAEERRTGYPCSGDDDQALVRRRVFTQRKREPDEDRELERRLEGENEKRRPTWKWGSGLTRAASTAATKTAMTTMMQASKNPATPSLRCQFIPPGRKPALFPRRPEASML